MFKELVNSSNLLQNKYKFIFVNKPGAGGSLAVLASENEKDLSVVTHSSSFYIRPHLYENSHNVDNFRIVNQICLDQPLGIFSKKYSSIKDIVNKEVQIGIIPGSITSLIPSVLEKNNATINLKEIPYKNTPDATTDMLGGHIDSSVDFVGSLTLSRLPKSVSILGITGKNDKANLKTFISQNIHGLEEVTTSYYVFLNKNIEIETAKELSSIFYQAINDKVKSYCENEYGTVEIRDFNNLQVIHNKNIKLWKKVTEGMKVN
jgi:tripartite-type tricarboxylate transporter receptor subunit TctC